MDSKTLTPESYRYAVKELGRRAGASPELIKRWRVEITAQEASICVQPGTDKRVSIPICARTDWQRVASEKIHVTHADWMRTPANGLSQAIPDFILPFSAEVAGERRPLFSPAGEDGVTCSCDILSSVLLTLSRYEEMLPAKKDGHERFPASASLATRQGFLHRPIVDELGFAFEQALSHLLPGWNPADRALRVKLSHDADLVGLPFSLKATLGHTIRRRRPMATLQDFLSLASSVEPMYLELVRKVVRLSAERGLDSAVYWQAAPRTAFDTGYDPRNPKVRKVIEALAADGVELGVHPSYGTFRAVDQLQAEVRVLRDVFGMESIGGRQHYLRWCPDTWLDWETCGLAYDSTVGYADQVGFRAGTCIPYHPWLLALNREADLLEIPLIVMDETVVDYMGLTGHQQFQVVSDLIARCRLVGGVFTLLWHNSNLIEPAFHDLYVRLLDSLAGSAAFDWKQEN